MLRLARNISQRDLANRMEVTYQQIQKYENGLNKISVGRLWQICEIFEVAPNQLFENVLSKTQKVRKASALIPNMLASSQDMKMMMAFQKVAEPSNRVLLIKLCQAMAVKRGV